MTESVSASGSKQDISGGGESGAEAAQAPSTDSKPNQTKHAAPKKGLLRGFTSALGSLARALSMGENEQELVDPLTEPPAAPPVDQAPSPANEPKIRIKPGPQLNAIRSDLQHLLAELNPNAKFDHQVRQLRTVNHDNRGL